jgi:hypothetical protein
VVRVSAAELLAVMELPSFVLFARRDPFDPKRDSVQLFRQKLDEDINDPVLYMLHPDVNLRMMFISVFKGCGNWPRLYYDILKNVSPEQLKQMVVRTCDVYDMPCDRLKQIRWPMKPNDPLSNLLYCIQTDVYPCKNARLLIDVEGVVHPLGLGVLTKIHRLDSM